METQERKLLVCLGVLRLQRRLVTLDLLMRLVHEHRETGFNMFTIVYTYAVCVLERVRRLV